MRHCASPSPHWPRPLLTSIRRRVCVYLHPSRLHPANVWYVFPNPLLFRFGDNCPKTISTNAALSLVAEKKMWRHGQHDGRAYQPGVGGDGGMTTSTGSLRLFGEFSFVNYRFIVADMQSRWWRT
jgi:hypothetical protein